MSGETEETTVVTEASNEASDDATQQATLDSLQAEIAKVININKELIASRDATKVKLREAEEAKELAKEERQGVEGELDKLEQKFSQQLQDVLIDSALEKELTIAGARNVDVAKKLLDKQDISVVDGKADVTAIQATINALKENESYLFLGDEVVDTTVINRPAATPVARAGEPENENIVNKELQATTSIEDLKKVIEKHNVI